MLFWLRHGPNRTTGKIYPQGSPDSPEALNQSFNKESIMLKMVLAIILAFIILNILGAILGAIANAVSK